MARNASREKLGFYPTPPQSEALLAARLQARAGATLRLLDPCCGEGVALAACAGALTAQGAEVTTYGVELSPQRAEAARTRLDERLAGAWSDVRASRAAFSLLWLNPPYDWSPREGGLARRLEEVFLRQSLGQLALGGLLVYLVPEALLARRELARLLASRLTGLAVHRLPPEEFAAFRQVVVTGHLAPAGVPDPATVEQLLAWGRGEATPPTLAPGLPPLLVPPAPAVADFRFHLAHLSPEAALAAARAHGVHTTRAWQAAVAGEASTTFQPAIPFKLGHLAALVAGGLMGDLRLGEVVARGRAIKVPQIVREGERETRTEQFSIQLTLLHADGRWEERSSPSEVDAFLAEHATELAALVQARFRPRYNGHPEPAAWARLGQLGLTRPPLPGAKPGLLDAQKHATLALARTVRAHGYALLVGEMGVGKTTVASALADQLGAFPALVLAPGHVLDKWAREVAAIVPGARVVIIERLADLQAAHASYQPGERLVCLLGRERAKLGGGWAHVARARYGRGGALLGYACPDCGELVQGKGGVPLLQWGRTRRTCAACGAALYEYGTRYRRWPVATYIHRKLRGFFQLLIADELHEYAGARTDQGLAFHRLASACRYTVGLTGTLFKTGTRARSSPSSTAWTAACGHASGRGRWRGGARCMGGCGR